MVSQSKVSSGDFGVTGLGDQCTPASGSAGGGEGNWGGAPGAARGRGRGVWWAPAVGGGGGGAGGSGRGVKRRGARRGGGPGEGAPVWWGGWGALMTARCGLVGGWGGGRPPGRATPADAPLVEKPAIS